MIDSLTILLSLGLVMYVVVRAVIMDRARPWFETIGQPDDAPPQAHSGPTGRPDSLPEGVLPWRERTGRALRRSQQSQRPQQKQGGR
jgi:hypothetical protein